ncbi:MAG: tripartite tricarboxylate transporter substrate binding protein [Betaproteobacteria bacterium]|nr:tripartite tricarboxylate transporter substrate binding protein [Betaproteobacteria bacterium]
MQLRSFAVLVAMLCAFAGPTWAQAYPAKPVRFIIPYGVGGAADIVARLVAPRVGERLGQQVIVDNRPGAGAIIGTELGARAAADGYVILLVNIAFGANPSLHRKLPYDSERDLAPVTLMTLLPTGLFVHPSLPVRSPADFIKLAKARPGTITYATAGIGSANHLAMASFQVTAGLDLIHIPYKGGGAVAAEVIAGQVASMFITLPPVLAHVKSGRLRALGIGADKRHETMPEVPTINESGLPGFKSYEWQGVMVPAATPKEVIARLHQEISAALNQAEIKTRIAALGGEVIAGGPAELAAHIKSELATWSKVVGRLGIKAD